MADFNFPDRREMPESFWEGERWLIENNFTFHGKLYSENDLIEGKDIVYERFIHSRDMKVSAKINVTYTREGTRWDRTGNKWKYFIVVLGGGKGCESGWHVFFGEFLRGLEKKLKELGLLDA